MEATKTKWKEEMPVHPNIPQGILRISSLFTIQFCAVLKADSALSASSRSQLPSLV